MGRVARLLLIIAGSVLVVLGVIGMFVPLLPTTVFLLMAAWCYARSSDRFLDWLLRNRIFGEYIRNYREGRGIRVRDKAVTLVVLWATMGYSLGFLDLPIWVRVLLVAIAVGVTTHIVTLPTFSKDGAARSHLPPPDAGGADRPDAQNRPHPHRPDLVHGPDPGEAR